MAIKRLPQNSVCPRYLAAFVFLLTALAGLASPLWAQVPGSGVESRVIRLSWTGDDYALRYQVLVEKQENGAYRNVYREFTQTFSVEIPLPPGNYRCSVIAYDFLDRPSGRSEWISMEVRSRGPGTLETGAEEIVIDPSPPAEKPKLVDIYFSIAWMPVVPVHFTSEDHVFDQEPSLSGLGFHLGVVSSKPGVINPGFEFEVSWHGFPVDDPYATEFDPKTFNLNTIAFDFNLVMQKYLSNQIFILSFRAGIGITFQFASKSTYNGTELYHEFNEQYGKLTLGVSFILQTPKSLYLETGLDYAYFLTESTPGCFWPFMALGFRF